MPSGKAHGRTPHCPWCASALGAGNRQCTMCERCERCGCWCGPTSWQVMVPMAVMAGMVGVALVDVVRAVWRWVTG